MSHRSRLSRADAKSRGELVPNRWRQNAFVTRRAALFATRRPSPHTLLTLVVLTGGLIAPDRLMLAQGRNRRPDMVTAH